MIRYLTYKILDIDALALYRVFYFFKLYIILEINRKVELHMKFIRESKNVIAELSYICVTGLVIIGSAIITIDKIKGVKK